MTNELTKREDETLEGASQQPLVRPPVDIYENREEYLVIADIPNVPKERLSIQVDDSKVTIEGTVEQVTGAAPRGVEFSLAGYQRSFEFREAIAAGDVRAELNSGVLRLHLPKPKAAQPKRIAVTSA